MIFKQLFDSESSTYTYFLADEKSREAILIDPVKEKIGDYLALLDSEKFRLKYALDTHVHADHVTASGELREKTGCATALHEKTAAACASLKLKDGEELRFGEHVIKTLHTPGHTPCHASYLVGDRVFTGDSLLIGGCGRTDFQNGSATELYDAITGKLFTLAPDTLVYPGHDYNKRRVSSIQQEIDTNARLAGKSRDEFVAIMNNLNLPPPKKIHEAVPANQVCGMEKMSN